MCGVLGSIGIGIDQNDLNSIEHRGPDDFGMEHFEVADRTVHFAHRRLSIIDTSPAGHQPMVAPFGNYALIFNGEIYNHQALRRRLPPNINYKGHSDTETILYYLMEFGIGGVQDFNGIFAFAFLDTAAETLYLARDPFGVKPMYYHHDATEAKFIFASEQRPIRHLVDGLSLDREELGVLLRLRYNPAPRTLLKGIDKIRPGHYLKIDIQSDQVDVRSVFYGSTVSEGRDHMGKHSVEGYGEQLETAVKRQLLSDVELGILLSGGIDSALVAAVAQQQSDQPIKAFTIGFEGSYEEDEINDAAATADYLGLDHYYRRISFTDFLGIVEKCTRLVEEPLATTSMIPMYYLSELAAEHVKVVLTGQGADEPLGGYTRYKSELIAQRIPHVVQQILKGVAAWVPSQNEPFRRGVKGLAVKDDISRFLMTYEVFSKQEIMGLVGATENRVHERLEYFYQLLESRYLEESVERMMQIDTRLNLPDDLLNYTDKITMHFSLECRVPMLDLELVRYIESLPRKAKLNLRRGKIIHKRYAEKVLPSHIVHRKKKAFKSPTDIWFREKPDQLREILLNDQSNFGQVFNLAQVSAIIDQHIVGQNREKQLFLLLSIFYWMKEL